MRLLLGLSWLIDGFTAIVGKVVSWLILIAVFVSSINAIIRKIFNESSNGWLELQWYLFGAVFMLAAAWTLARREHIRIDLVSNLLPRGLQLTIGLLGHLLFLMPFSLLMIYLIWPSFGSSVIGTSEWLKVHGVAEQATLVWASISHGVAAYVESAGRMISNLQAGQPIGTGVPAQVGRDFGWDYSPSAGGLPIWPAKAVMLGGFALLALQGVSEIFKQIAIMAGVIDEPETPSSHGGGEVHEG